MLSTELKNAIDLIDWWLKGKEPSFYTHRGQSGINFNLDGMLSSCWDGQSPLAEDIVYYFAEAIHLVKMNRNADFLALISNQDDLRFPRLGIIPLGFAISYNDKVGLPYVVVRLGGNGMTPLGQVPNPSTEYSTQYTEYLRGASPIIISDEVSEGDDILTATRVLELYGANKPTDAICLVARPDMRTEEPIHPASFLNLHGINLWFSHEMRVENFKLQFNPNQQLMALTT